MSSIRKKFGLFSPQFLPMAVGAYSRATSGSTSCQGYVPVSSEASVSGVPPYRLDKPDGPAISAPDGDGRAREDISTATECHCTGLASRCHGSGELGTRNLSSYHSSYWRNSDTRRPAVTSSSGSQGHSELRVLTHDIAFRKAARQLDLIHADLGGGKPPLLHGNGSHRE